MSYILDALKKADAERERGHVPGLHTQPAQNLHLPGTAGRRSASWLMAAGLAAVLAGGAWWWWQSQDADRTRNVAVLAEKPAAPPVLPAPATTLPAPVSSPAAASAAAVETPAGAASATGSKTATASAPEPAATEQPAADAPAAAPASDDRPRAQMAPAQVVPTPARPPAEALAKRTPPPKPPPVQAAAADPTPAAVKPPPGRAASRPQAEEPDGARLPSLAELPQEVRQTLPKLTIGGATYSDNPAWRMVIINGQVFKEGEKPSADLKLEQIRPKSAVLNYKGQRYTVSY